MTSEPRIPVAILGASGYVGGELMRLLAFHPRFQVRQALSRSHAGERVTLVFPHLALAYEELRFSGFANEGESNAPAFVQLFHTTDAAESDVPIAVFGAAPHGESAALIDRVLTLAYAARRRVRIVDTSADFRLPTTDHYAATYGCAHGAPDRLREFFCGLPELAPSAPTSCIAHPGCFTTAVTLACAPFAALELAVPHFCVSAVTGSTGSGREPKAGTHHPERHGDFCAYSPLEHRHRAEMELLLGRLRGLRLAAEAPTVAFVPHSGPFARGIHATVQVRLTRPFTSHELTGALREYYEHAPFVTIVDAPPHLKEVVGTNGCRIAVHARGVEAVVFAVIDNLTKGAAGGAIQWMNRLYGLDETTGLRFPGLGWN
ncbi:MAG: N-acetyl-gamma-glutamyl-phosphate reductase [Planctomycetota bacterium]